MTGTQSISVGHHRAFHKANLETLVIQGGKAPRKAEMPCNIYTLTDSTQNVLTERHISNWQKGTILISAMNSLVYILEDPGRAEELEREKQWREGDSEGKHSKIKYHLLKGSSRHLVLNTAGAHMIKGMGKK